MNRNTPADDDMVPGKEWRESLNATCNRLSTQYLLLLKAAAAASNARSSSSTSFGAPSSSTETSSSSGSTAVGGMSSTASNVDGLSGQASLMATLQDPPPPALAYEVLRSQLSCQLATENLCVAASQLLTLIRQLRLSILITDTSTMTAEQVQACMDIEQETLRATQEAQALEYEWIQLRNGEF